MEGLYPKLFHETTGYNNRDQQYSSILDIFSSILVAYTATRNEICSCVSFREWRVK